MTLAVQYRLFRKASLQVLRSFDLGSLLRQRLSLGRLGFSMQLDGVLLGVDGSLLKRARETLALFAGGRTMRTVAGLARPLIAY